MLFHSYEFLVFLILSFAVYWFVLGKNLKAQNFFLLIISYIFYGWWDWRFLSLILFSSLIDYWISLRLKNEQRAPYRTRLVMLSIVVNLGLLVFFKYFNFFSDSFASVMFAMGIAVDPFTLTVVLPVGISFYTFQTMSYTLDVYARKMEPSNDWVSFLAYVSFFPQLVAGPIERAKELLPQFLVKRTFTYQQGIEGVYLILWGLAKKLIIADNCAVIVNRVFENYTEASSLELVLGLVFFAFQIYGDFSGYSDIATGAAKLFGFNLMTNFKTPYFSRDIAEFWRRWHVSLSSWFRDYVYIPLGGSQGTLNRTVRNVLVIFFLSGLWHGANWTFVIWGIINALYFLPLLILQRNRKNTDLITQRQMLPGLKDIASIIFTFSLTCLAWTFFRATSVTQAWGYLTGMITHGGMQTKIAGTLDVSSCLMLVGSFVCVEWFFQHVRFPFQQSRPWVARAFYSLLIVFIMLFRHFGQALEFIYFQF